MNTKRISKFFLFVCLFAFESFVLFWGNSGMLRTYCIASGNFLLRFMSALLRHLVHQIFGRAVTSTDWQAIYCLHILQCFLCGRAWMIIQVQFRYLTSHSLGKWENNRPMTNLCSTRLGQDWESYSDLWMRMADWKEKQT